MPPKLSENTFLFVANLQLCYRIAYQLFVNRRGLLHATASPFNMESHDLAEMNRMSKEALTWSKDILGQLDKQYSPGLEHVKMTDLKKLLKPDLLNICIRALHFVGGLLNNVEALKNSNSSLQNRVIESQQQVISTQAELSECKSEQLEALRKTVETSVIDSVKTVETSLVDSVKTELQSYSSAVQRTPPNKQVFSSEALTRVVRNVVEEEDRSRNVVIFGLNEEDNEKLNEKVAEVFESIGQKPRAEACRVGRKKSKDSTRPVNVKLSSSLIVDQLLANVKTLRNVTKFSSVFVCPDRSLEQRKIQKELVKELKEKAEAEPDKRYFIRAGKIQCTVRAKK